MSAFFYKYEAQVLGLIALVGLLVVGLDVMVWR